MIDGYCHKGTDNCNLFTKVINDSNIVIENKLHVRDFDQPWESAYDGLIYLGDAAHGQGLALDSSTDITKGNILQTYERYILIITR